MIMEKICGKKQLARICRYFYFVLIKRFTLSSNTWYWNKLLHYTVNRQYIWRHFLQRFTNTVSSETTLSIIDTQRNFMLIVTFRLLCGVFHFVFLVLGVIMLTFIMLSVIKLNVLMLNVTILCAIMVSVIALTVILLSFIMLSFFAEYYFAECYYAQCWGTIFSK